MKIRTLVKQRLFKLFSISCFIYGLTSSLHAQLPGSLNQTADVSPVLSQESLPFRVQIELENFSLPNGIQSFAFAQHEGLWLLIAGRTNGLHNFNDDNNNFPPQLQNRTFYVVDPSKKIFYSRSINDPSSGLNTVQIDLLSVTSPEFYQIKETLYLVGGYGVDSLTGQFSTKGALSAINVPGIIDWVMHKSKKNASHYVRHLFDPTLQVTGGYLTKIGKNPFLLIFGQNFLGYYVPNSNGVYTQQVRRFHLIDDGKKLALVSLSAIPYISNPNYRRRDLNVVPTIYRSKKGKLKSGLVALSGVFTVAGGIWTLPVIINSKGESKMADPLQQNTFKQAMNNYACPTIGLYSKKQSAMHTVLFGGLSYGFFSNGQFLTDAGIPFINQVTTVKIDKQGQISQYLMDDEYPELFSTQSNPGNLLLFGTSAQFIQSEKLPTYSNKVLKLDKLKEPIIAGYIVGGIQSTLPDTVSSLDSAASPYIFRVTLIPVP